MGSQHLRVSPEHLSYRETITRPHRFEPRVWQWRRLPKEPLTAPSAPRVRIRRVEILDSLAGFCRRISGPGH